MNNTRGLTPPKPTQDHPIRSTVSNKTLGIVGTPHGHSIAKLWSTKTQAREIEGFPPRTHQTLGQRKPQNRAPFLTGVGGSKGKEPRRVHANISNKSSRKQPRNLSQKINKKGLQKSPKNEQEQHIQSLRNHAESSIHDKEVHTRSSLSPDHPSLSKGLTINLSI
jgi:hypothetical protein